MPSPALNPIENPGNRPVRPGDGGGGGEFLRRLSAVEGGLADVKGEIAEVRVVAEKTERGLAEVRAGQEKTQRDVAELRAGAAKTERDLAEVKAGQEKTQKDVAGLKVGFADMQKRMGTLATKDDMMAAITALEMRTIVTAKDLEKKVEVGQKSVEATLAKQQLQFYTLALPAIGLMLIVLGIVLS